MYIRVSYISWYVLGGMSLTCLPIFAWQWGRKHNNTEKNEAFWVKPHSCLILYNSRCVFFYQSVYFFTNGVYQDLHHNIMFQWFCKTLSVLVKKCTPCQGVVWFSPSKCHIFTLAFQQYFTYTIEAPWSLRTSCKTSWGCCPRAPAGAYVPPDPANLRSEKLTSQPTCFCCAYFPKSVMNSHRYRLFNISCINTHFDMFFKN